MADDLSSENLRKQYLAALERRASGSDIWRLFLEDEWFRSELRRHAEFVLRTNGHSLQLLDDVQQEVIVNLSVRLKRSVYFGLKAATVIEKFANWIGTLVLNECRDALRRLHLGHESASNQSPDEEEAAAVAAGRRQEQVTALKLAIDELPTPQSAVLRLFLAGHNLRSIAKQLKLTYKQVRLAICSGIDQLRADLG